VENKYEETARAILGVTLGEIFRGATTSYNRKNNRLPTAVEGEFGRFLVDMACHNDEFAKTLIKTFDDQYKHRSSNPVLNQNWIDLLTRYAKNLVNNFIENNPLAKGNDVYDALGRPIAGEKAAYERLGKFVQFLTDVLAGKYTVGGNYKTNWAGVDDYYLLTNNGRTLSPLAVDIMREFNTIFKVLLKGIPGMEDIDGLFDVRTGPDNEILWGIRGSSDQAITGTAHILMMVHLGAVEFESDVRSLTPRYGLLVQGVIERLFEDPQRRLKRDLKILAECNGMAIDYKKGFERHDGYLYFEMYFIKDPRYRVLCRVNEATVSSVRDGVELFYFGLESAPTRPSATMEMFRKALKSDSVSILLANCPRFRTRFIFDVLADATDPLEYPAWA
nr:hypothetical protein [Candidatus Sigynarchaeum springense]